MLFRDSSQEYIERIRAAEAKADRCIHHLRVSALSPEMAVRTILTAGVFEIESCYERFGDDSAFSDAAMTNLGRYCPMIIRWLNCALPESVRPNESWHWTPALRDLASPDIVTASQYDAFQSTYPMWYSNRTHADVYESGVIRFVVNGGDRDRQVSAYHKGLRPLAGRFQKNPVQRVQPSEAILRRYARLLSEAKVTGLFEFDYEHSYELARRTYTTYKKRLGGLCGGRTM